MPTVRVVGPEARARLTRFGVGKGYQQRQPYREAIAGLSGDQMIEVEPEPGETLRQIRVRVARAAKELGQEIRSGETRDGTLLVWLAQPRQRRQRRARGSGLDQGPEAAPWQPPAEQML